MRLVSQSTAMASSRADWAYCRLSHWRWMTSTSRKAFTQESMRMMMFLSFDHSKPSRLLSRPGIKQSLRRPPSLR